MEIKFYNTAAENLLHNFLEVGFKYSSVSSREIILSKIQELCPFKVTCDNDFEILTIDLGEITVKYKLFWSITIKENFRIYHLKDIQIYDKYRL